MFIPYREREWITGCFREGGGGGGLKGKHQSRGLSTMAESAKTSLQMERFLTENRTLLLEKKYLPLP